MILPYKNFPLHHHTLLMDHILAACAKNQLNANFSYKH